jgi:Zn-dependent protease with chaperone function
MDNDSVQKRSRFQHFFTTLSQKRNDAMRAMLLASTPSVLKPTFTASKLLALTLSLLVHATSLAKTMAGVYLILVYGRAGCLIVPGIVFLVMAWLLKPRLGKFPNEDVMTRTEAPRLYALVDSIAQTLSTPTLDGIQLTADVNAGYRRVGLRQRRLLILGKPLWDVLQGQERVALLAHELAHAVNGDANRGLVVYSACNTLVTWYHLFRPPARYRRVLRQGGMSFHSSESLWELITNLFTTPLAVAVRLYNYGLRFLLWHESRRAEYLADYVGSTVSGTQATRSLLGKVYCGTRLAFMLNSGPYGTKQTAQSTYERFLTQVTEVSLNKLERISQPDPGTQARLDLDHPPIGYRLEFLRANPVDQVKLTLTVEDERIIREELNAAVIQRYKYEPGIYADDFQSKLAGAAQ